VYKQHNEYLSCYAGYYRKIQGKRKKDKSDEKNNFLQHGVKNDITALVRLALCANKCGNNKLAIDILEIYDLFEEMPLNTAQLETNYCSHVALLPLGGIGKACVCWQACDSSIKASDYAGTLESFTDITTIPKILAHIRARTQLKALAHNVFVEITKDNDIYTIYPWHYCKARPDLMHYNMDWVCGKKFILKNCVGTIKTAYPSSRRWRKVEDIDSITVIEEQEENCIKKEVTHILYANQITDTTESAAENKLIQRPLNNNNFLATLFRITQPAPIFSWLWSLFASKRT
jgi:hypothetical protein